MVRQSDAGRLPLCGARAIGPKRKLFEEEGNGLCDDERDSETSNADSMCSGRLFRSRFSPVGPNSSANLVAIMI